MLRFELEIGRDLRRNNRSENTAAENSERLGPNFTYAEAVRMFNVSKLSAMGFRTIDRAIIMLSTQSEQLRC